MRTLVLICLLLGACKKADDYPIGPGGPGGPGSTGGDDDAAVDGTEGTMLAGQVCLVTNLATPFTGCDNANATGFTVTLGGHTATTNLGGFEITRPLSTGATWQVTGAELVPSTMPFGPVALIPVIKKADYDTLAAANNVTAGSGQGIVVANITRVAADASNAPLANVVATPTTADGPLYDPPGSSDIWGVQTKTGADGTVWYPDLAAGSQSLTFTLGTTSQTVTGIPVVNNATGEAMTFIRVEM